MTEYFVTYTNGRKATTHSEQWWRTLLLLSDSVTAYGITKLPEE